MRKKCSSSIESNVYTIARFIQMESVKNSWWHLNSSEHELPSGSTAKVGHQTFSHESNHIVVYCHSGQNDKCFVMLMIRIHHVPTRVLLPKPKESM